MLLTLERYLPPNVFFLPQSPMAPPFFLSHPWLFPVSDFLMGSVRFIMEVVAMDVAIGVAVAAAVTVVTVIVEIVLDF